MERLKAYSSSNISSTTTNIFPDEREIQLKNGLIINSISKTYDKKVVVNQVSMNLEKGEAVGLLGPNGAGKTTCFYMIAGLIDCDKGDILLNK